MIRAITRLLAVPDKLAMLGLMRGMAGQMQLSVVAALLRSGAMRALRAPSSFEELVVATAAKDADVLQHLLDLAVRRGVLRRRAERYRPRSRLARCLARDPDGPVASMVHEVSTYHHEVFERLPERLRGEAPRDYLTEFGTVVAQSSRIMAPWIQGFTVRVVGRDRGRSILELGCGSGAYLTFYAGLHDQHHGVGIDLDARVVESAVTRLDEAGLASRFSARCGDMRDEASWPEGRFDVITAHQNVYYFDADQRVALWRVCRERLTAGGQLAIVTPTSGGPMSSYFSLILLSTAGCHDLPSVETLVSELRTAGFSVVRKERLIPGDAVWGIAAR